ncbi:SusD/RagB family nutrient-binding outer membrane lipoprotein [Sphingobacterium sp. LRF_L2]|uniref:SusD/RagB family nutrient-binding outer membrane lipoprotein n=1 Tax=Sphingobacterium sp. LRF_L2 TaxID=3369421 RepID=UPI003F609347
MKKKYSSIKAVICLSLATFCFQACDMDINVNPNRPSESSSDFLLPPAILKLADYETVTLNELGSFFGGYWGKANDVTIGGGGATNSYLDMIINYSINDEFANTIWESAYSNLYNIKLIEEKEQELNPAYAGLAKIMRGWYFLRLVDHYNNVPFYEASNPSVATAKYDGGELVYREAVNLITEGTKLLASVPVGTIIPGSDDILFKGDLIKWRQLANTLKLRALIRQSEVASSAYIQQEIAVISSDGSGFLTVDALVNPGYTTSAGQMNGFWTSFYRTTNNNAVAAYNGYRPTRFLLAKYKEFNDPRMSYIYTAVNGEYNGVVLGAGNDVTQNYAVTSAFKGPQENNNNAGGLFKSATQSALIFSAAESYFLQAEAAFRGWTSTTAVESLYTKAIQASFNYIGVSSAEQQAYVNQQNVKIETASDKLTKIIEQKWLALNGINGAEAWSDYRRLGIPNIPGSLLADPTGNVHPIRLRYPASEVNNNREQVSAQGNIVGTSKEFKVFWQK